jgi:hypothetical protein
MCELSTVGELGRVFHVHVRVLQPENIVDEIFNLILVNFLSKSKIVKIIICSIR